MKKDRICKHCGLFFENVEGRIFSNHVRWCDKNLENGDKGVAAVAEKTTKRFNEKFGEILPHEVTCSFCKKIFIVHEREKQFPKREFYFCSRSCANTRSVPIDTREKIRETLSKSMKEKGVIINKIFKKTCPHCSIEFESKYEKTKFCSRFCSRRYKPAGVDRQSLKYYRMLCQFKFNLSNFPNEFDFSLVRKHGWYSAKNRGNNLGGVSRDHIVSVKYGYLNNIDPKVISHPANCKLLIHNDNISKHENCGMTLEELIQRIEEWDNKYKSLGN